MLRRLTPIAWLLLVGCGFSAELRGNGDAQPPSDARNPDGTVDDLDGDGIMNAADNCPMHANPGQYDEDTDAKGDECDPCPHLTGASDNDPDDDGIGTGCDPRPTAAGDVLVYWNGFHVAGSALPAGMTMIHGNAARWSISDGDLVFLAADGDWGMPAVETGGASHTTDSTFVIVDSFTTTTASAAGVAVDIRPDDTQLFECQARTNNNSREVWRRNPQQPDGWTIVDGVNVTTPDDTYRIVFQRTPTGLACATTRAGQPTVNVNSSTATLGNTRAGLFARNVQVRFRYFAVYRSP